MPDQAVLLAVVTVWDRVRLSDDSSPSSRRVVSFSCWRSFSAVQPPGMRSSGRVTVEATTSPLVVISRSSTTPSPSFRPSISPS